MMQEEQSMGPPHQGHGQPMMTPATPDMPDMETPDMNSYGMEDDEPTGFLDYWLMEVRAPLLVAALAFIMTIPQVSNLLRTSLSRFTVNAMYVNIIQSLIIGVVFYIILRFLF